MVVILGSKSPRRQELLQKLGVPFQILTADVDETMDPAAAPQDAVAQVSARKAAAIAQRAGSEDLIVCADTVVVLGGQIMGKPADREDAVRMLTALSDKTHEVLTGVTVQNAEKSVTVVERTLVTFRRLLPREIAVYVESGEPMDKAGGYGVQGAAASFVSHLDGDYFNVMGLPLCKLTGLLRSFGVKVLGC